MNGTQARGIVTGYLHDLGCEGLLNFGQAHEALGALGWSKEAQELQQAFTEEMAYEEEGGRSKAGQVKDVESVLEGQVDIPMEDVCLPIQDFHLKAEVRSPDQTRAVAIYKGEAAGFLLRISTGEKTTEVALTQWGIEALREALMGI